MSTILELINELRPQINDRDVATFQPDELLNYFNQGVRTLRRLIASYKPMLIVTPVSGMTNAGQTELAMPSKIIRIIDIRVDKRQLESLSINEIDDLTETGKPTAYYQQGMSALRIVPISDVTYPYSVLYVPEVQRLKLEDETGFPNDFDDVLIEYAGIRSGLRNMGSAQSEKEMLALWHDQVKQLLTGMETSISLVKGYFDSSLTIGVSGY